MITIEKRKPWPQLMHGAMPEGSIFLLVSQRTHGRIVRNPAQGNDHLQLRERANSRSQEAAAGVDFGWCGFVFRRYAAHRVGDHAIDQGQAVVRTGFEHALGKTELKERCVEKIAREITRKGAPRTIGTFQSRCQTYDQQTRARRSKRWNRPIMPIGRNSAVMREKIRQPRT